MLWLIGPAVHHSHLPSFMDLEGEIFHRGWRKATVTPNLCLGINGVVVHVT